METRADTYMHTRVIGENLLWILVYRKCFSENHAGLFVCFLLFCFVIVVSSICATTTTTVTVKTAALRSQLIYDSSGIEPTAMFVGQLAKSHLDRSATSPRSALPEKLLCCTDVDKYSLVYGASLRLFRTTSPRFTRECGPPAPPPSNTIWQSVCHTFTDA